MSKYLQKKQRHCYFGKEDNKDMELPQKSSHTFSLPNSQAKSSGVFLALFMKQGLD